MKVISYSDDHDLSALFNNKEMQKKIKMRAHYHNFHDYPDSVQITFDKFLPFIGKYLDEKQQKEFLLIIIRWLNLECIDYETKLCAIRYIAKMPRQCQQLYFNEEYGKGLLNHSSHNVALYCEKIGKKDVCENLFVKIFHVNTVEKKKQYIQYLIEWLNEDGIPFEMKMYNLWISTQFCSDIVREICTDKELYEL